LCLTNQVEVLIALRRFDAAQLAAETALSIFEQLRAPAAIADVQRMLGVVFRETNRLSLAQSHLEAAVELAGEAGSPVSQGEALCEAGRLHGRLGHLDDAIDCLLRAGHRFSEVPAAVRGPEILSGRYPNLVRAWCELVATVDPEAADHSDRVAATVGQMAALLELPAEQQASTRLAAKLHEVGRLRTQGQPAEAQAAATVALLADAPCLADVALIAGEGEHVAGGTPSCWQLLRAADRYDQLVARDGRGLSRTEALALLAKESGEWGVGVYEALDRATAGGLPSLDQTRSRSVASSQTGL
jgi:tetratricopeptide (TPR) repeat protein